MFDSEEEEEEPRMAVAAAQAVAQMVLDILEEEKKRAYLDSECDAAGGRRVDYSKRPSRGHLGSAVPIKQWSEPGASSP
eukprot:6185860-Pleurochrysis_carterae.AAC.1